MGQQGRGRVDVGDPLQPEGREGSMPAMEGRLELSPV
jgi:hypothetical protein